MPEATQITARIPKQIEPNNESKTPLMNRKDEPSSSSIRRGFTLRNPVFTKPRKETRASYLDAFDNSSPIRQSQFWGMSKFVLVSLVYWMGSSLYRQYHDRDYFMDKHLFSSLTQAFVRSMMWWLFAAVWSCNAHLNLVLVNKFGRGIITKLHRFTSEAILIGLTATVPRLSNMGVISSCFCFCAGSIYSMKAHSYVETNFDVIAQTKEDEKWPRFGDYIFFVIAPTLVYEPEFPRFHSEKRYRNIVMRSVVTIFTILFTYVWLSEKCIPVLVQVHRMSYAEGMLRLFIPIWVAALIFFYFIFESVCNVLADITGFADRQFYGDWWNSTTFEEFNRLWNKPVYEFLLRHVYLKLLNSGMSKLAASAMTVTFSAFFHELGLFVILGKLNCSFFLLMLIQPALFWLQNVIGMKGSQIGNYFFWFGLVFGLTMAVTHYGRMWAEEHEAANIALGWLKK